MENTNATGNYYTLNHLVLITGLTDRTLRSYISSGLLTGEKINGLWHFTPEQVEAFIRYPAVRPSIQAKKNGIVYDFLLQTKKTREEICMILDLAGRDPKQASEYFCHTISNGNFYDLHFSLDSIQSTPRVILRGPADQILSLVNEYYQLENPA